MDWNKKETEQKELIKNVLDTPTEYLGRTEEQNKADNDKIKSVFTKNFLPLIDGLETTESEIKTLKWLCEADSQTIQNISSLMTKAKKFSQKNYDSLQEFRKNMDTNEREL